MKFIRKVREGKHRKIYIGGIKVFSYKRKSRTEPYRQSRLVFDELKQYAPSYSVLPFSRNDEYKDVIWQLWLQGEDEAPLLVKRCLASVRQHAAGRKVVLLTEENLSDFIQLPDYILAKHQQGIISRTHLSDYIRTLLLAQYGGTWIDATCLLSREIPTDILNSDFFIFTNPQWMNMNAAPDALFFDEIQASYGECYHLGSSWFIHARRANCPFVLDMLEMLNNYWRDRDSLLDYFLFHYMMVHVAISSEQNRATFDKMPSYSNIPPHILQHHCLKPFAPDTYARLLDNSFIHKLTYFTPTAGSFLEHILSEDCLPGA